MAGFRKHSNKLSFTLIQLYCFPRKTLKHGDRRLASLSENQLVSELITKLSFETTQYTVPGLMVPDAYPKTVAYCNS
jgi:hypothetical protein